MTAHTIASSFAGLRKFGPYVLVELLLPGGTLLALLLWLSQRFVRSGFGNVRQYLFRKINFKTIVAARPRPGRKSLCLCPGHTAVLSVRPSFFRQRCEMRSAPLNCCA